MPAPLDRRRLLGLLAMGTATVLAGLLRRLSVAAGSGRGRVAVWTGSWAARLSRRLGIGEGSIIGGRITLAVDPAALRKLAAGRRVALVSSTTRNPTTTHLLAAALRSADRAGPHARSSRT